MSTHFFKIQATVVIYFFITTVTLAQNNQLSNFEKNFENLYFQKRIAILKTISPISLADKAKYNELYGTTYYKNNRGDLALSYFMKAIELYKKVNNYEKAEELNITVAEIKYLSDYPFKEYNYLLEEVITYAKKTNNPKLLSQAYKQTGNCFINTDAKKAISYYQKALVENKKVKDTDFECKLNNNIGLAYSEYLNKPEIGRKYFNKIMVYYKKKKMDYDIANTYINLAAVLRNEHKPDSAMIYYHKVDSIDLKQYRTNFKIMLYTLMSDTYKELKDYKKALEYTEKRQVYKKINDDQEILKAVRDIDAKYQTKENKQEISTLKKIQKKGLVFIIFLLVVIVVSILGYQNMRRKKKIIEQEQLIQTQKLENILQEHELQEIDKLLEGQEKERIKIANELHDNLGSMLATLKLNFQHLKLRKDRIVEEDEILFEKTDELLEEAYQKIRTIAHTQNAGVIGNEGLVPALYNIANKIAIPGKLVVEVIPFGLNERLENTLELSIFRMIQELLTNAVKYAQATEISISLTQHQDNLNIIIEDNGKGFNPDKINKKDSMGLNNIEKKVTQLGGTFTIDSAIGRGTSILIDIPL